MVDPESDLDTELTPTNATDWYVLMTDGNAAPFYRLTYNRPDGNTIVGNPGDAPQLTEIERALMSDYGIDAPNAAALAFAASEFQSTFAQVGQNASWDTITKEAFLAGMRYLGNVFPGPWMYYVKVKPSGGT